MENSVVCQNKITGKEYPLSKIFSKDFEFHIPGYQRPYAWTEEETGLLFDDLFDFYQNESADNYFLGSIVLIKDENKMHADVVDGQQRLTTLTILFSAIAYSFKDAKKQMACKNYLQEEGNEFEGIPAKPRLFLRDFDQGFFSEYIQNLNLNELFALDSKTLKSEAQKHIQNNCRALYQKINDNFTEDDKLLEFSKFVLTRCFLVTVSTPSRESAFRVFSVMNSRGLDLLPTDIIKSDTIGNLAKDEEEKYTAKWEELENQATRDGFNEVFTHTRTIFAMERPKRNLLEEFNEYVARIIPPKALIDDYLIPYTDAYVKLKNSSFTFTSNADEINELLRWLNKTNNYDWMPPAIKFAADHANDSAYILWFIRKLERLASYLLITAQDVNHRMDRYKWLLVEMNDRPDSSLSNPIKNVELTNWERDRFMSVLNGEIYTMPAQRRNYVMQRLDSFVSDGGASYNAGSFTIEHVLPQHPAKDSEWFSLWNNENDRNYWLNRIANLVPLTRRKNSEAQNFDFDVKKERYFRSKNGTSSFNLTTQVISYAAWTPEVVKNRQAELLKVFAEKWDLKDDPNGNCDASYRLAGRGSSAVGLAQDDDKFLVLKGSRVSSGTTDGFQSYCELRKSLEEQGIIKDGCFTEDYTFSSISAASSVILGRNSNGKKEWVKLDGRSFEAVGN